MSLLLNIDTALETASVSLALDGHILQQASNTEQRDHGAFLQTAIQQILKNTGIHIKELDAIAVIAGPGSYTGLRVGMASAKGLCYAINKPLITVSTLKALTFQAIRQLGIKDNDQSSLFCPMVDARRMEVFTSVYDKDFNIILNPCALILDESSFVKILLKYPIYFFGNGSIKWKNLCKNDNAQFLILDKNPLYMSQLTYSMFINSEFSDLVYIEPFYIKDFFNN